MSVAHKSQPNALAQLGTSGERSRRAQGNLDRASGELASSLRRVLPFLSRKRVAVIAGPARSALFAELPESIPNLAFTVPFVAGPTRAPGVLALDAMAVHRVLDGVLGGGDPDPDNVARTELSSAQTALASRVVETILKAFAEALKTRLGLTIELAPGAGLTTAGVGAVCTLTIAGGGIVAIAVPLSVLDESPAAKASSDGAMAAAMVDVEVDVVAELGKVKIPLTALASLQVGDVVQLTLGLDECARICAGGAEIFRGKPKSNGGSIGIEIVK
ncbi:MAG: hypothetical protein JWP97_6625 [Labilithrix sp.]|nr:hypothetical protein [Labilithrix sp.]